VIVTASKDQRLVVWKVDFDSRTVS